MKIVRVLIVFTVLLLVFGIAFLVWSVHSRLTGTEYQFQVDAILSAASVANGEDPLTTDPDKAVIAEYDGQKAVVVPGNYVTLSSYLRKDCANMLFSSLDRDKALKLTVCGEAVIYAAPDGASEDVVLIELTTMGRTFRIRTDGGNQWQSLLSCCMKGTYHDDNIPLE